jgi:tRNA(Ile)-lysidine synthase TilS/MesJ
LGQDLIVGNFTEQVAEHIAANSLFSRRQKILIAVSGGVDSMVLLNLLHELSAEHSWQLAIAHFNHQLRGRESDRDGAFVRKTAERLGMQFFVGEGDVASNAAASGDLQKLPRAGVAGKSRWPITTTIRSNYSSFDSSAVPVLTG